MEHLAGHSHISFEGNLSRTRLFEFPHASQEEPSELQRNILWPRQDFVVLPLLPDQTREIISAIGGTIPRVIIHIQIEKNNQLELGLYDNFQMNAMFIDSGPRTQFLGEMMAANVIRVFYPD
jgi:hypothetical protein